MSENLLSSVAPDLYDLEFERLRGVLVLHAEVDVAAALAGLAHVGVEGEQREGAVLPEAELKHRSWIRHSGNLEIKEN